VHQLVPHQTWQRTHGSAATRVRTPSIVGPLRVADRGATACADWLTSDPIAHTLWLAAARPPKAIDKPTRQGSR
jgi:hypothetical protein